MAAIAQALRRPTSYTGWWSWVTTVDHKRIGVLYGVTAFIFFLTGGVEALIMRIQLARPDQNLVSPEVFNQMFTMHGTVMVFLAIMPFSATFFNLMIPLMIGARDVAFPRLNAFSYWMFLMGGLFLNSSWFLGGSPNAGWFSYANITEKPFNLGHGIDFWVLGLLLLGVASLAAAFNFIVTIINMRAPGMSLMRMPVFVWMTLVTSFLIVTAFPVITVALIELMFDRKFGTNFFMPGAGGDPVLWQHLFWVFGHPEVYILILPAMGIVSEVLPTYSRKPLFGYPVIVFSGITIGFMGWMVWSHHMFTVGLGPVANSVFALTTMAIAVPTGVKIFNWMATMWRGSVEFKTAMLFAVGFIAMFIIGGLSGIMHSVAPSDAQQQDTYFIVAHIHYVLFGGAIFAVFSGIYYWFPKASGRLLGEGWGKLHFWLTVIGFNVTFFPMHISGLLGMPRRIYTYPASLEVGAYNLMSTIGAFVLMVSLLVFLYNFFRSVRHGELAGNDPWDGRTLEWSIPSPPPIHNFDRIPTVHSLDAYWEEKQHRQLAPVAGGSGNGNGDGHSGQPQHGSVYGSQGHTEGAGEHQGIHIPSPSIMPLLIALGLTIAAFGMIYNLAFVFIGVFISLVAIYGWTLEPPVAPEKH